LRRFWAPCTLPRHPSANVDGIGRDSQFRRRMQTRVDLGVSATRTSLYLCTANVAEHPERAIHTLEVAPPERTRCARFSRSLTDDDGYLVSRRYIERNWATRYRSIVIRQ
jgi:hypothetical protein